MRPVGHVRWQTTKALPQAVFLVSQSGQIEELAPLTRDIDELRAAATFVRNAPLARASRRSRLVRLVNDYYADRSLRVSVRAQARLYEKEETIQSIQAMQRLAVFCEALAAYPGRKGVVWVTAGIKWDMNGPYVRAVPYAGGG